jgi:hypothetical protein
MPPHNDQHCLDFVSGIDDHGLFGLLIAHDRTITLQRAHRKNLVDHLSKLP